MILAATGLQREARIMGRGGVAAIAGGGDAARLEAALEAAAPGARAIVSTGLAGALVAGLVPGDWIVGSNPGTDPAWRARLLVHLPGAQPGLVAGQDRIAASPADKHALNLATGALAVDMESHVAARVAARHGLPFAVLRVISDGVDAALPPAAQAGMKADGSMDVRAVIAALLADPRQLPGLLRTALDAERAFRALLRGYDVLARVGIGFPDLGELPLDMA